MYLEKKISKNKNILIQLSYWKPNFLLEKFKTQLIINSGIHWFFIKIIILGSLFNFSIKLSRKCDHSGFSFNIEICGLNFIFEIYDIRHWNNITDNFCE
jgi:hypothetical protein